MKRALSALALTLSALACEPQESPAVPDEAPVADTAEARTSSGWVYERNLVFTTLERDSAYLAPWFFGTRTLPGAVERSSRGWLALAGEWESVLDDRWETPPSRAPWRILPHGNLRIVVGPGDAVETLLFQQGSRALEMELGDVLMEWTAAGGEVFRLLDATLVLSDQELPGMVLDMARTTRAEGPPPGDWAFLVSGDSLQMVLERPRGDDGAEPSPLRAWARLDFRDLRWSDVSLEAAEVRAYPPARRDIPVAWELTRSQGDPRGSLQTTGSWAQALDGPGPLLPLEALFSVSGTVSLEGRTFPVQGLLLHRRP